MTRPSRRLTLSVSSVDCTSSTRSSAADAEKLIPCLQQFLSALESQLIVSCRLPRTSVGESSRNSTAFTQFRAGRARLQPCRNRLEQSGFQPLRYAVKPTRAMSPPGTYFVSFTTWQRQTLFVVEAHARLFLKTLYGYKRQGRFQLHEFVVMPEHVHLILTPAMDITLERAMQLIKGGYSHAVGVEFKRKGEVWQRGFTDHRIRDPE